MKPVKIGTTYYVFWTCVPGFCGQHPNATRHKASLYTADKREAKALIANLEQELASKRAHKTLGLPHKGCVTPLKLSVFKLEYLESVAHDKAASTIQTEECHLNTLMATVGDIPLAGLSQEVLDAYKKTRLRKIAPRSWNSELATLKAVFAWGLRRSPKLYTTNPFNLVSRVNPGEPTIEKYITHADLIKVVRACNDPFWINVIAFLYATCCRGEELRALKWSAVHHEEGYINVLRPKEKKKKGIAITFTLARILDVARRLSGDSEYVFPRMTREGGTNMLTKDQLHHKLQKIGRKVGIKLSPHMLRHSGITDALKSGAPVFSVQAVAGHTQVTTTQGYHHSDLEAQRAVMNKLNVENLLDHATTLLPLPRNPLIILKAS